MLYDFQTDALLPYCIVAVMYLGILFLPRRTRDFFAFALLGAFCLALGLRNIDRMPDGADPVIYASILANASGTGALLGGVDYTLFSLLRNLTGPVLGLASSFFVLHLLYLPILFLLYWVSRTVIGMFYLLVGWMLFVNSGVLLLCNFFRQGLSVFLFLALLIAFSRTTRHIWSRAVGALALPVFHVAAAVVVPALFICKTRRYFYLFGAYFALLCVAIWEVLARIGFFVTTYLDDGDQAAHQAQLLTKVAITYAILLFGIYLRRHLSNGLEDARGIQHAAAGFLVPTAALLLTYSAPIIGLRYLYYSHSVAFTFLASVIGQQRKGLAFPLSAFGIVSLGVITWTYPTVTKLLVW
jgi:hypothetical protein